METGSAASDEDFSDDEVDEGDSDGSNGISDYDTSQEDHLLVDDVDLSLMKTRSATKRAKRASSCENKNNPASNVVSSAAAAPEAPIVPAAHAAFEGPVASVAQSSAANGKTLQTMLQPIRTIFSEPTLRQQHGTFKIYLASQGQ